MDKVVTHQAIEQIEQLAGGSVLPRCLPLHSFSAGTLTNRVDPSRRFKFKNAVSNSSPRTMKRFPSP